MRKGDHSYRMDHKGLIEESAEDLYENAPCGYLSTLPNGLIVKANKTFLKWMGYAAEELLYQKKFQDLLPIGGRMYYETHYAPLLRMQGFVTEINFDLRRKKRQLLPVLVNTTQLKDENSKPILNRTTVFNITDRKGYEKELLRAKKQAEEATRIKAEFLSTVSHEIRTPMNAIISIANLLLETNYTQEQSQYLSTLKASSENLLHLINDILDFSKLESGKVALAEREVDLKELVTSLLHGVRIAAQDKGLALKLAIDKDMPPRVLGDPVKIGQVLTNLLGNAVKFTERGSVSLELELEELTDKEAVISFCVEDTGIGIPKDKLEKVFEEFAQADYDINLRYGGTGLGLSISRKLLALYGSKLTVKSQEGQGSTFCFALRLKLGQAAPALPNDTAAGHEPDVAGVKLLLVEDNAVNVMVVTKYFEKWGVDFDVATNGVAGVAKVMEQDYDLVLMDLHMPEMDGYEATAKIRSLPESKYKQLPIIALSASTEKDFAEEMAGAGINDFISKPFNATELRNKIAHYAYAATKGLPYHTTFTGQQPMPTAHTPLQNPDGPAYDLSTFEELLGENEADLEELVKITIRNFEVFQGKFQAALVSRNLEDYKFSCHKITVTLGLLNAWRLQHAITQGKDLLEEAATTADQKPLDEIAKAIHLEFDVLLAGLNATLLHRWNQTDTPDTP
ncbi:response regulator [Pontibacter sp. E15-1]|uniref:response regulator n=1 Tax=Pontibacter sp. E15-1 TaxID=2919918 RepID=UPI001F500A9C|nr:PAS domain-containing hybrid sensor histidine kinase/response regulator [Pontibacter sp. E15-1]MCJ8163932.1 response regulator [Pontibacter sp. E15-1]